MSALIPALLDWAMKNWKRLVVPALILLAIIVVIGTGLYIAHLRGNADDLRRKLATAQATNASNQKEITEIKASVARAATAVAADETASRVRADAISDIKRNIYHATPENDACNTVGPQLRAALDGLRKLQRAGKNSD